MKKKRKTEIISLWSSKKGKQHQVYIYERKEKKSKVKLKKETRGKNNNASACQAKSVLKNTGDEVHRAWNSKYRVFYATLRCSPLKSLKLGKAAKTSCAKEEEKKKKKKKSSRLYVWRCILYDRLGCFSFFSNTTNIGMVVRTFSKCNMEFRIYRCQLIHL